VKWHNIAPVNGRELVADDVVWSYSRQKDQKVNAAYLASIQGMTAVDNYTLRFALDKPDADILLSLADSRNKIAAKEVAGLAQGPVVGTGAWIHEKNGPNLEASMVRNPDYFLKGLPYLDRLEFLRMNDNAAMITAFRAGQLDVQSIGIDQTAQDTLTRENPKVQISPRVGLGTGIELGFRTDMAPFKDLRVRQAVSKAIDRQAIVDTVYFGAGTLIPGFTLPTPEWILPADELKRLYQRDVTGARRLLQDAGVPNLEFELSVGNYGEAYISAAELAVSQMKDAGITARIKLLTGPEYTARVVAAGEYLAYFAPAQPIPTTNADLLSRFRTGGPRNIYAFSDPELDALIDKQAASGRDPEGRKRLLQDIQRRLIDRAPLLGIATSNASAVMQPYVRNYQYIDIGEYDIWTRVWLDK
jgi:peptide/nickel transport system substrate-binding protein